MSGKNNNGGLNKIFQSPYKDEIEKRLAVGQSPRAISKWLESRGELISHTTINEYKKKYFDTAKVVSDIIKDKQEETAEAVVIVPDVQKPNPVNQQIASIRAVNHVALLYENIQDMREYLAKLQAYEPVVAAHAAKGIYQEIRATIETLEKLQSGDKDDSSSVAKLLTKLKAQQREMLKDGQTGETGTSEGNGE
jgi:hypothetical protein